MPLTDTEIRKAQPSAKPVRMYDGGGLYLEVTPKGGKWWRFKYRFDGKEKLLSMGTYPEVPLAGRWLDDAWRKAGDRSGFLMGARDKRDEARALLASGIDPGAERKAQKHALRLETLNTFEVVARQWLKVRQSAWKPGTYDAIEASLVTHVFPDLGNTPLAAIKPADIRRVVKAIEAKGAAETATRVFQRIRSIYRHALSEELVEVDATYPIKPAEVFKPRKVRHRASISEKDAPEFLRRLAAYDRSPTTRAALELLILTATRPGELRGARWDEIDEERALWRIPGARMKMATEHLVPLSKQALSILRAMREISGARGLVFPSPFYPGKPLSDGTLNSALARMGYKGTATAHGFRTLFSTCANEAGWNGDLIEKQLAHEERDDVRSAYNRAQHLAKRTELMQWWADYVDTLRKAAKVLPFKAA